MNIRDFDKAWDQTPKVYLKFEMIQEHERGGVIYPKGTIIYGFYQSHRVFCTSTAGGIISLPLAAVKFIGYEIIGKTVNVLCTND